MRGPRDFYSESVFDVEFLWGVPLMAWRFGVRGADVCGNSPQKLANAAALIGAYVGRVPQGTPWSMFTSALYSPLRSVHLALFTSLRARMRPAR
jgi:hypothetical protein